jgi:ankyrin repeat protein
VVRTGDYKLVKAVLEATSVTDRRIAILCLLRAAAKIGQIAILHNLLDPACTGPANGLEPVDYLSRQTILRYAVRHGHTAAVEYLLPFHREQKTLRRLLGVAAKAGQVEICKRLLANNPALDLDDALYVAAQRGQLPVLEVLVSHQGAVSARPEIDLKRPILAALWNGRLDSLRYLVSNSDIIAQRNRVPCNVFSRVELVKCLLQRGILEISDGARRYLAGYRNNLYRDHDGTLLHLAVKNSDLELARYVIQHASFNSSILEKHCNGYQSYWYRDVGTALDLAQYRGETEIASLLIAHGAINHNIAPKDPPRTEQNPAQPPSPYPDSGHEIHDSGDSDTDIETDIDSYSHPTISSYETHVSLSIPPESSAEAPWNELSTARTAF